MAIIFIFLYYYYFIISKSFNKLDQFSKFAMVGVFLAFFMSKINASYF